MSYQQAIREDLASLGLVGRHSPAVIEAWMRLEHGTLDHLSKVNFRREVAIASACADASRAEENRALVASYGLDKEHLVAPEGRASISTLDAVADHERHVAIRHDIDAPQLRAGERVLMLLHIADHRSMDDAFPATVICASCDGTGTVTGEPCVECAACGDVVAHA